MATTQLPTRRRFRRPRVFTLVFLAVQLVFVAWLVFGVGGAASSVGDAGADCGPVINHGALSPTAVTPEQRAACVDASEAGAAIGVGIGALLIIFLWVAADVILGVCWLILRRKR